MAEFSFLVDPGNKFKNAVNEALKKVDDLTIPFQMITREWFKSNRAFFKLKGPGKFADLSDSTKAQKAPNEYPILRRSGALEASITDPTNADAISLILNRKTLILGTSIPYAPYLHFGTKKMPARPFVMIGAEQTGPDDFNRRQMAFIFQIKTHVENTIQKLGTVKK